jgi:uncharacterized protein DUF4235
MAGKSQNAVAIVATLGVTAVVKKIIDRVWKLGSGGKQPPTDPADPETEIREAVLWAVVSGAAISVARMFLARRLARNERRATRVEKAVHP